MDYGVQSIPDKAGNTQTNDYHQLPPTDKQFKYARHIAQSAGVVLPWDIQQDRRSMSIWITEHRLKPKHGQFDAYPSSKQVAFAERIARIKRNDVPPECFKDKTMMSRWIDSNK